MQRQLVKIFLISALVFIAKADTLAQGLLEQFENELKKSQISLAQIQENQSTIGSINNSESITNIELTSKQIDGLIFLAPEYYTELFLQNSCALYVFLSDNIQYLNDRKITILEVEITTGSSKKIDYITTSNFSEIYLKSKCLKQKEFFKLTKADQLKQTLERQKVTFPADDTECNKFYDSWITNPQTSHMCGIIWKIQNGFKQKKFLSQNPEIEISQRASINEEIRTGQNLAQLLSDTEYSLFNKLCTNLHSKINFCSNYNKSNFWKTIENYTQPDYKVSWKCASIVNKASISRSELIECMKKLEASPSLCETKGAIGDTSLSPMPNCEELSDALLTSKLKSDFQDCPSEIGHNGIITTFRILKHFGKVKKEIDIKDCRFPAFASTYQIFLEAKETNKWPLSICFIEPVDKKEVCEQYVPGNHESYTYAQNNVISNILYTRKFSPNRAKCQVIDSKIYRPERLDFRAGCYGLIDKDVCNGSQCPIKIMLDGREIITMKTKGEVLFAFDKFRYNSATPSLIERLEDQYQIKSNDILSLTSARFHLDNVKDGIIAGMGCLEDLLPEYFNTTFSDQCTPMPFLIDGHKELNDSTYLLTRISIDDIHSPRLINWSNILNAISRFARNSPLKKWSFYGLR